MSSTPFASVLDTNYAPEPLELDLIKAFLLKQEERVRSIGERISDLEMQLMDLRNTQAGLTGSIERHRKLLSPFRRVPDDVWREIFLAGLPTSQDLPTNNVRKLPLILTVVCRRWRDIALNTPRLWNRLKVSAAQSGNEEMIQRGMIGLREWLARSGSLHITCNLKRTTQVWPVTVVFQFSRRLKRLELWGTDRDTGSMWSPLKASTPEDLPMLTELAVERLDIRNSATGPPSSPLGEFLTRMGTLHDLTLDTIMHDDFIRLANLTDAGWPCLVNLSLHMHVDEIAQMVTVIATIGRLFPSVASLDLELSFALGISREGLPLAIDESPTSSTPTVFSNLRRFHLRLGDDIISRNHALYELVSICSSIVIPQLEDLKIPMLRLESDDSSDYHGSHELETPNNATYIPFHHAILRSKSACGITHLEISVHILEKYVVDTVYVALRSNYLVALRITNSSGPIMIYITTSLLVPFMKRLLSDPSLCPALKELIVERCSFLNTTDILDFMSSRPTLERVDVHILLVSARDLPGFSCAPKGEKEREAFVERSGVNSQRVKNMLTRLKETGMEVSWRWTVTSEW